MNEPGVTCGGPDGRRLLAFGSHVLAAEAVTALAAPTPDPADGRPGAAAAAAAPSASPDAVSTTRSARQGRSRAVTGTPKAGGSGPRYSRPPSAATPRSCPQPAR